MSAKRSLAEYERKRDFRRTKEPRGRASKGRGRPRFVIQKHDATTLHYDFRLEVGGVLKSWAVPKGLSTDPRQKRLAVPTEDHPLEYGRFEGVIPQGEYGAGPVLVWDTGSYRSIGEDQKGRKVPLQKQLARGHATVWLEGKKLRGGYALTRIGNEKKERWLVVKMNDEEADARRNPVSSEPKSVLSNRSLRDIIRQEDTRKVRARRKKK